MNRRTFLSSAVLAILVAPLAAEGQQAGKVRRIGFMSTSSRETAQRGVQVWLRTLKELGWVEGQNLLIEWRWAEGNLERLPALAAELVSLNVDLIVAVQGDVALAAKKITQTIPIVFVIVSDPVAIGLVASLARPGGNVTGFTLSPGFEIHGKQLELLKEIVPKACPSPKPRPPGKRLIFGLGSGDTLRRTGFWRRTSSTELFGSSCARKSRRKPPISDASARWRTP
jgi:putative ABC transport system substrate-binding protein